MSAILAISIALVVVYIVSYYLHIRKYPKGPFPLPIIGNLLQFPERDGYKFLADLQQHYGNIFTVWLPRPTVFIMEKATMKEAFSKNEFSGRNTAFPEDMNMKFPNTGIIFSQGEEWVENRRVSLHILRDFGMGKNVMENQVAESMRECLKQLESAPNKDNINLRWPIQLFVANVITHILFGYHHKYNDCDKLVSFCNRVAYSITSAQKSKIVYLARSFPWLKNVPIIGKMALGQIYENCATNYKMAEGEVETCLKNYDPSQDPECFVHAYYREMKNNPVLNYDQMVTVCVDFYVAGIETTTTTLRWAMLLMASHPEIQKKCRDEILKAIGKERMCAFADKTILPYCTATVNEVQRFANIVGYPVFHRTTQATTLAGHSIPDDTLIAGHQWNVLSRSPVFQDGDKFRPERFLLEDGVTMNKKAIDEFIPFGIGKRQCAGEGLARVELFIGFVSLLQNYKIKPVKGQSIDLTPTDGLVLLPKEQNLKITAI